MKNAHTPLQAPLERQPFGARSRGLVTTLFLLAAYSVVALLAALVIACGSSSGGGTGEGTGGPGGGPGDGPGVEPTTDTSVDEALTALGVDTTTEPRVDEAGSELPDDYSPLGSSMSVGQVDELFVLGVQLEFETPEGGTEVIETPAAFLELDTQSRVGLTDTIDPGTAWEAVNGTHPGMGGASAGSLVERDAAAADVDGDGRDEIAIVYVESAEREGNEDIVWLEIVDETSGDSPSNDDDASTTQTIASLIGVRDVTIVGGDFDGDGVGDLAVGVTSSEAAHLMVLRRNDAGSFEPQPEAEATYLTAEPGIEPSLDLAAGNLDRDNGHELVVVFNEMDDSENIGAAHYWIIDDARRGYTELVADEPIAMDDGIDPVRAVTADVAIGDIDGDGMGEIVFGGLTEILDDSCDRVRHVYLALDDGSSADAPFARIGEQTFEYNYIPTGTGCSAVSHQLRMRRVHVNAFDVDGDGLDEIQANLRIFDDWVTEPAFTEIYSLPDTETLQEGQTSGGVFSAATTAMATGDVNGDGREDLISFAQWRDEISVWGLEGPSLDVAEWRAMARIDTTFYNGQSRVYPVIVPANLDKDGLALSYSDGEHRFVFTEPILIAAVAAAPCLEGIGQQTGACVTTYGTSERTDGGVDGTVTVSASTFVTAGGDFFGFGAEAESRLTTTASFSAGLAYSLEETVEYTTGPLEDTVIFTTVPLDQYIYTVVSHPDESRIGEQIVINLPRTPVTFQVERTFYNEHVQEGGFQVGSNVFLHAPGDLDSYPTEGDAEALIDTGGLGHLGPAGELVDAAGEALGPLAERLLGNGLMSSRATTVGQGSGQTSTEIRFSQSTSYRAGAEVAYSEEVQVTAGGVGGGVSIGGSVGAGLSWGSGSTTIYRGTVGSIDADNFSQNVYSFGLFTYIYNYGNPNAPQFEVVNYWVDR